MPSSEQGETVEITPGYELSQNPGTPGKDFDDKDATDSKFGQEATTAVNVYDVEGGGRSSEDDEVASVVVKDAADIGAVIVRLVL